MQTSYVLYQTKFLPVIIEYQFYVFEKYVLNEYQLKYVHNLTKIS